MNQANLFCYISLSAWCHDTQQNDAITRHPSRVVMRRYFMLGVVLLLFVLSVVAFSCTDPSMTSVAKFVITFSYYQFFTPFLCSDSFTPFTVTHCIKPYFHVQISCWVFVTVVIVGSEHENTTPLNPNNKSTTPGIKYPLIMTLDGCRDIEVPFNQYWFINPWQLHLNPIAQNTF